MKNIIHLFKRIKVGFQQLLQNYTNSGHKSTVLKPLTWFISILLLVATSMFWNPHIPMWVPVSLYVFCLLVSIFFLLCYGYCLKTNPDLIRSEKFVTDKLRIEKGYIGNDETGLKETFNLPQNTINDSQITEAIDGI